MFTKELSRYISMVRSAIQNHRWEQHANGILLPRERVVVGGFYQTRINDGRWSEPDHNLLPTEGLNFTLDLLGNNIAAAAGYIALHANTTTPIAGHNAAGYTATYSEITSGSEGYSQSTRVLWDTSVAASAAVNNYAAPASYTIVTASTLTVNGAGLLTVSTKGGTTGALLSASKFAATRTLSNTDSFQVKYQIGMTSS